MRGQGGCWPGLAVIEGSRAGGRGGGSAPGRGAAHAEPPSTLDRSNASRSLTHASPSLSPSLLPISLLPSLVSSPASCSPFLFDSPASPAFQPAAYRSSTSHSSLPPRPSQPRQPHTLSHDGFHCTLTLVHTPSTLQQLPGSPPAVPAPSTLGRRLPVSPSFLYPTLPSPDPR